jgi:hypothetical protein
MTLYKSLQDSVICYQVFKLKLKTFQLMLWHQKYTINLNILELKLSASWQSLVVPSYRQLFREVCRKFGDLLMDSSF